jgi:hypothetical protein
MEESYPRRMKIQDDRFVKTRELVRALKDRHWSELRRDRNVVGAAFGRRTAHGERTDEPALVLYVIRKAPKRIIPASHLLPRRLYVGSDPVEVDIVETGPIFPLMFTARERPATLGISISNGNGGGTGTLGAVVTDNIDGSQCLLTNNHVIARKNAAANGDPVIQPGLADGGSSPADNIATLKRFINIMSSGNQVDAAIAQIAAAGAAGPLVTNAVHNALFPPPGPNHPAVGLLFGGGCSRTILSPIGAVLNAMNISFPVANATVAADIDMNVEKAGRTTEYTTSTIQEIDATVTIDYKDPLGECEFDNQITTSWMSDKGDSGSLIYAGGAGGDESKCDCAVTQAAETALGTDLKQERCMADVVRDKFLRQTRIGKWAVDLFFEHEDRLVERFERTAIDPDDRAYARKLYDKYVDDARRAFIEGEKSDQRITDQHLRDARSALKRAQKYLERDEREASERLFELVSQYGKGKNAREILALLNDEKLFEEVKAIAATVRFLC